MCSNDLAVHILGLRTTSKVLLARSNFELLSLRDNGSIIFVVDIMRLLCNAFVWRRKVLFCK